MKPRGYRSKSHWNYRVLAHVAKPAEADQPETIFLWMHEVYYKKGKPESYTERPISVNGESVKDIKWSLRQMKKALKKPILWHGDRFPEKYKPE